MTAHLSIRNVRKMFGHVEVLKGISLDIPRGCFMTFLGPSGCGKTTMLRTIAGFYQADAGEIRLGGRLINDVPSHQRGAIMVFQDYALFPHMTVEENITYGLRLRKIPLEERRKRLEKTMAYLGIQGLEKRSPGQISGGQQQRVALARALIMEPEVLLLDEPLSNLDAKLRLNIRAELRQIQKTVGITTIYVTHDQGEALALSDLIAVMDAGRVVQLGTPQEIYYKPDTAFVADFIGTANLISGTVTRKRNHSFTAQTPWARLLVEEDSPQVREGDRVYLCCRPETIGLAAQAGESRENLIEGRIVNHIFEGSLVRYWVRVGETLIEAHHAATMEEGVLEGAVFLKFHPRRIHLIRQEEGE
jgi:ABC-type Fe3+/spermidine/putrescine transport system ATPase subunit